MEKHSENQKSELLIFNYPPKTSFFSNQILNPTHVDYDFSELTSYGGTKEAENSPNMSCTGLLINIYKLKNKNKKKNEGEIRIEEVYKEKDVKAKKLESLRLLKVVMGIGLGSKTGRNQSKFVCESSNIAPILELLPRREINLWVRRNAASPPTLLL